jgi:hypothetical protein
MAERLSTVTQDVMHPGRSAALTTIEKMVPFVSDLHHAS